jgi:hypothetical protein
MVAFNMDMQLPVTRLLLLKALSGLNSNRVTVGNYIFIKDIRYIVLHVYIVFWTVCYPVTVTCCKISTQFPTLSLQSAHDYKDTI